MNLSKGDQKVINPIFFISQVMILFCVCNVGQLWFMPDLFRVAKGMLLQNRGELHSWIFDD